MWLSRKPSLVHTVLGSCVAITMHHPASRTGAICHAQQPSCPSFASSCLNCPHPYRYVDCCVRGMLQQWIRLRLDPRDLELKIFGGASSLSGKDDHAGVLHIGDDNVRKAMEALAAWNLAPVTGDVGGSLGRKLFFFTDTGEVFAKYLTPGRVNPRWSKDRAARVPWNG